MQIGFVSSRASHHPSFSPNDAFIRFDSGAGLTYDDASYHTAVLGTTGSGKTQTIVLPAIDARIRAGHSGLILDIKGNLTSKIRALARRHGREQDILEIGTAPSCEPRNIIRNLPPSAFYDFCLNLVTASFSGQSGNMDFHTRGVGMARDCFALLSWLAEDNASFTPTLALILEMLASPAQATALFQAWARKEDKTREQVKFHERVRGDYFHVMSQNTSKFKTTSSTTQQEQLSYAISNVVAALEGLLLAPGVSRLCAGPGIDMRMAIEGNKIVILRFAPETGAVSGRLARVIISAFYDAIFVIGVENARPSFVILDEFQEIADLSEARRSDASFVSLAREFKCGILIATQSVAALASKAGTMAAEKFLSNCNGKLFFFSDDPATRSMANRYTSDDIIDLAPGAMLAVRYDSAKRRHYWGIETMAEAFESLANLNPIHVAAEADVEAGPSLGDLIRIIPAENEPPPKPKATVAQVIEMVRKAPAEAGKIEKSPEQKRMMLRPDFRRLRKNFPDLIAANARIMIPAGWMAQTEAALRLFQETGLDVQIASLRITGYKLMAINTNGDSQELHILNHLLESVSQTCMACGKYLEEPVADPEAMPDFWNSKKSGTDLPFCEECFEKCGYAMTGRRRVM